MATDETTKVFVGSIPSETTEETLRKVVSQFGQVRALFYERDDTTKNKGWGFVTYSTMAEALNAIIQMDKRVRLPGGTIPMEARFAGPKSSISSYGNVHMSSSPPVAQAAPCLWQQYFTDAGIPYYYHPQENRSQWHRPPEMDSPQADTTAPASNPNYSYNSSANTSYTPTFNSSYTSPSANSSYTPGTNSSYTPNPGKNGASGGSFGPPGSNLFLFHVPNEWSDGDLMQLFKPFGNILSCRIKKDHDGRNCGYGFVSFDNSQSAFAAIGGMNGYIASNKHLKVQLKKGEEHLLPPELQARFATMQNRTGAGGVASSITRYTPY